jgi:uncharacterized repeat protein (TIGR03803 family)
LTIDGGTRKILAHRKEDALVKHRLFCLSLLLLTAYASQTTMAWAQALHPTVQQVFVFYCTPDFLNCPNGFDPELAPVQLSNNGFVYAGTFWGGAGDSEAGGTLMLTNGVGLGTALYTFEPGPGNNFPEGNHPSVSLLRGPDGNLYGVTQNGGPSTFGVMFRMTPLGTYSVVYNFCSLPGCVDAGAPLVLAKDGNFYGVASTVFFRLTPQGVWSQISTLPVDLGLAARLIQGADGNFYGVGSKDVTGFAFSITPAGQYTQLHEFDYPTFASSPLIQATDGYLYGATNGSGPGTGIYRLSLSGDFQFIHQMTDQEGYEPVQLLQASDGNLWGISDFRNGSFFIMTLGGTSIYSAPFNCFSTGCQPLGLMQASNGTFYGVAGQGGNTHNSNVALGTIFRITGGLMH